MSEAAFREKVSHLGAAWMPSGKKELDPKEGLTVSWSTSHERKGNLH